MTDGEARLIGTVKFTNVDSTNRLYLAEAILQLKYADGGKWKLVRAYNKVPDLAKLQRAHNTANKKTCSIEDFFVAPKTLVSEDAGYVFWKDKKVVIFYSNNLASTPSSPIFDGDDQEAIFFVHGVIPIKGGMEWKFFIALRFWLLQ